MRSDFEKKIFDYGAQIEEQDKYVKILEAQAYDLEIWLNK